MGLPTPPPRRTKDSQASHVCHVLKMGDRMAHTVQKVTNSMDVSDIKTLTFDVFGTVVDWRASITKEGQRLGSSKGV